MKKSFYLIFAVLLTSCTFGGENGVVRRKYEYLNFSEFSSSIQNMETSNYETDTELLDYTYYIFNPEINSEYSTSYLLTSEMIL